MYYFIVCLYVSFLVSSFSISFCLQLVNDVAAQRSAKCDFSSNYSTSICHRYKYRHDILFADFSRGLPLTFYLPTHFPTYLFIELNIHTQIGSVGRPILYHTRYWENKIYFGKAHR